MKVLIDIAHPAHIHYFRNFSKLFEQKGHECLFTLRDKGIIVELADHYKLNYKIRSVEQKSKVKYMLNSIRNIYRISKEFKPDIFLDMGTVVASPVASLLRKSYIAFDDTEVAVKSRKLHMPFTDLLLTPDTFFINLGSNHIKFHSLMEMFYLHFKYFKKETKVIVPYIKNISNYVLIRFVSWEAHHDKGQQGLSYKKKIDLVDFLAGKGYDVIISAEGNLPSELQKYRLAAPSNIMHQLIAHARFLLTEGATMASEAVLLGVPVVYINSIINGYSIEQKNIGLMTILYNENKIFDEILSIEKILNDEESFQCFIAKSQAYFNSKIDATAFMVWFIENYPESKRIMKENPDYQYRFK